MNLAGSEWTPPGADAQFIQFRGDGSFIGHAGCNRMFGTWEQTGDRISITVSGLTKMMCPAPLMAEETQFVSVLNEARAVEADHIKMTLLSKDGVVLQAFQRADWD